MVKSRRMRWASHLACMGMRTVYGVLVGKARTNRPLGRPRFRRKNIKTDLGKIEWGFIY
jgi:hypothetical protein